MPDPWNRLKRWDRWAHESGTVSAYWTLMTPTSGVAAIAFAAIGLWVFALIFGVAFVLGLRTLLKDPQSYASRLAGRFRRER